MAVINDKIIQLLNYRIQEEEFSSRLYHSMYVWLKYNGYEGAAKAWKKYSEEEREHADWVYNYLMDLNIMPEVLLIRQPQTDFKGLPNIIALSYQHELEVTEQCKELARVSKEENDYMTLELAQRFLKEQVDELAKTQQLLDELEVFGDSKETLRMLDNKLGEQYK